MSSHWDWADSVMAEHDKQKPFAPENGQPLKFEIGDPVIYTPEEGGAPIRLRVIGHFARPEKPCGMYAAGARYYLDWSCHWFPVTESRLQRDYDRIPLNMERTPE